MQNSTKYTETCTQLEACCKEMAAGFAGLAANPSQITPDALGEAVGALAACQAISRVLWSELVAERAACPPSPLPPSEYSVQLLDAAGEPMAGASFTEPSDDAAQDEARALALLHEWCRRVSLLHKSSGRTWTIEV